MEADEGVGWGAATKEVEDGGSVGVVAAAATGARVNAGAGAGVGVGAAAGAGGEVNAVTGVDVEHIFGVSQS